jgi:DNA-binding transcriptional regulator YiaG
LGAKWPKALRATQTQWLAASRVCRRNGRAAARRERFAHQNFNQLEILTFTILNANIDRFVLRTNISSMITAAQLRAARAMLHMDQRKLARLSGLSLPTIQRMEASDGVIRGNVDSLMKLVAALDASGIELISDNATSSSGGRGVRLKRPPQ